MGAAVAVWAWQAPAAAAAPAYASQQHEDEPPAAGDHRPAAEDEEIPPPQAAALPAAETPTDLAAAVEALRRQPLLPDLQTLPPGDLRLILIPGTGRRLLRFTNTLWNAGPAPLELHGRPDPVSGQIHVWQRYFTAGGEQVERPVGAFIFHPEHDHWHLDAFARYELWSVTPEGSLDRLLAVNGKVSYCLIDLAPVSGGRRAYTSCGGRRQGLSVGWADVYRYHLPGQWLEATGLPDGLYAIRSVTDYEGRVLEAVEDNNVAVVYFRLEGNRVTVVGGRAPFHLLTLDATLH